MMLEIKWPATTYGSTAWKRLRERIRADFYCLRARPHQEAVVLLSLVVDGPSGPFSCAALGPATLPLLHPHPAGHQVAVKQL